MLHRANGLFIGLVAGLICTEPAAAVPLYGVCFNSTQASVLYDVNPLTGRATNPRSLGLDHLAGISFGPGGRLYGLTTATAPLLPNSLVRIDPLTGSSELVGFTGLSGIVEGDLAYDRTTGSLYGLYQLSSSTRQVFTLNAATGAATLLPVSLSGDPSAMAFDSSGKLYVLDTSLKRLLTVDKTTGATQTSLTLSRSLGSVAGMAIDPETGVFYVADGDSAGTDTLYRLNPQTGYLTTIGATGLADGLSGLAFLPEPGSLVLLGVGAALLGSRRRSCAR